MNTTPLTASWYDVLDVEPTASADEIRAAWRSAVADLDPTDRRFRVYSQAAEVLLDPAGRTAYDEQLAAELAAQADEPDRASPSTSPGTSPRPAWSRTPVHESGRTGCRACPDGR